MKLLIALITSLFLTVNYAKSLIIGTTSDNPPFAAADSKNNFYGFEIDIMLEVCSRIKAQCQFHAIIVSEALKLFDEGKVDLVIAAIIAPPRNAPDTVKFIFSEPYLPSGAQFLVRKDSKIQTVQDIRNKIVGVRLGTLFGGTLFKDYILDLYNKQLSVTSYPTIAHLINALQNKDVQAIFTNTQAIQYLYVNNKERLRLVGDPFPIGDGYTILGKKGEESLMAQINQALTMMEQDGSFTKIYNRYFTL